MKDDKPVNNGVNVEALFGAQAALANTPEAAKFKWRSTVEWITGTRTRSTIEGFYGLGAEQKHKTKFTLNALTSLGVKLVGRLAGVRDGKVQFSGSLRNLCELADLKLNRLLNTMDDWAAENGVSDAVGPPHRPEPTRVEASPPLGLDLHRAGIKTIVWATGFRPDYSWLHVPVLDLKGNIRHDGGVVTEAPDLYVMGLPFLRRRKSSLIDGVGDDARDLSAHLVSHLGARSAGA